MNTADTELSEISQGWKVNLHSLIHVCNQKTPLGVEIRIVATQGRGVEGGRVGSVDMLAKGHKVAARRRNKC